MPMIMKKGVSLPIETVIIIILAVLAMVVFLLFYFGAFGASTGTVEDIEQGVRNPLFEQAKRGLENIFALWSNGAFK